jgi:hypothetical protein
MTRVNTVARSQLTLLLFVIEQEKLDVRDIRDRLGLSIAEWCRWKSFAEGSEHRPAEPGSDELLRRLAALLFRISP